MGDVSLSGRRHFKAFMTDSGHAVFAGLDGEDLGFWGSGNVNDPECGFLTENSFIKPVQGDFEILLECAEGDFGWGGLLWTPLLEYHAGNGILILSQLELTRCFEDVPAACILLRNLLNRCAGYTGRKQAAAALAYESEEFAAFFGAAGLDAARDGTPEAGGLLVAEPSSLKEKDVERLRSFVAEGGTLLLPAAEPEHAGLVGRIAGTAVRVEKNEAYQAAKCASDLLCGVSDHDLCLFERVTYSPTTKENALLCCCDVTAQGAEPLLSAVNAPWRSFFVDRLDAEPIKMSVAQRSGRGFTPALYGLALGMGRGRIILSQVRLLHNEKVIRYYSRLLANLGAGIRTGLLTYEKKPSDYAIPAMMSLAYDSKQDYDAQEQYFKGAGFKLNNLGEGLYGWMVRRERKNGWITVPGSAGQTWFLTVFIESRINRNPALREAGELPDSSIVPDLAVDVNCPFRLFVNGVLYADHADGLPETGQTEIRDVLLGKGINNLLLVCFGSLEDIRVTVALLGKSGHAVEGIRYLLTLD